MSAFALKIIAMVTMFIDHLFASCIAGGLARGTSLPEMMQTAGSFLEKALVDSVKEQVPVNEGVNFEKYLHLLC